MKGLIYICYDDDYKNCQDTIDDPIFFNSEDYLIKYMRSKLLVDYTEDYLSINVDNENNKPDDEEIEKLRNYWNDLIECESASDINGFIQKYFEGEYRDYTKEFIVFDVPTILSDDEEYNYIKYSQDIENKYLKEQPEPEIQKEEKPKRKYVRKNKISS